MGFQAEHREKLSKVLNFSGATRYDSVNDRVTHIIVGDKNTPEFKALNSKGITSAVVSINWLLDSMEQKRPVSEENYLINTIVSPIQGSSSPLSKKVSIFMFFF